MNQMARPTVFRMCREVRRREDTSISMPIEQEIQGEIAAYLGAHYAIEPEQITDESTLEDLGVDSLGVLSIAEIIEKKYAISLSDERIASVRTLGDFKGLILLKIDER